MVVVVAMLYNVLLNGGCLLSTLSCPVVGLLGGVLEVTAGQRIGSQEESRSGRQRMSAAEVLVYMFGDGCVVDGALQSARAFAFTLGFTCMWCYGGWHYWHVS